jgi:hypothetical protein
MASNYGLNFGFRRSDESMAIREGRLRTPAAGTFRMGALVAFDPAAPGFLKVAAANQVGSGGTVGLLVQEESHFNSIYGIDDAGFDTFSSRYGVAKNNTLSVIWAGAGTKVWFRNSDAPDRADGRSIAAVTMATLTGVAIGDYLAWDGSKYIKGTDETDSMLRVTAVDTTAGYVEAVLVR